MPSSLEIAQEAQLRPIAEVAEAAGLLADEIEPYGRYKAKIDLSVLERLAGRPDAKLIDVTAITPTKAGEGKTTTSVSLTQGLGYIGRSPVLCLREASLGPVFGIKGGAAGGGYTQVVPMEDLKLHFTGDIHAIGAANNLLAAMLDAHILHGNKLGIDALSITWRRCVDINDRALRDIVIGLGGRANGYARQTGFDITAASEVMAIVAVAADLQDLRRRLGAITVARTFEGESGAANLARHLGIVREFGVNPVVAINRFPGDTAEEIEKVRTLSIEFGAYAAEVNDAFEQGGAGAAALAEAVVAAADEPSNFDFVYTDDAAIERKIEAIAKRVYGADGIFLSKTAREKIEQYNEIGLDRLPICMAKTHLSLSHDGRLTNAPTGFTVSLGALPAY